MASETGDGGGSGKTLRRYGPIALILVIMIIVGVVIATGGGDDDDDVEGTGTSDTTEASSSGGGDGTEINPDIALTYQAAEAAGILDTVEWGDTCDTDTGRLMMPVNNAYPCVAPYDEAAGNGGATTQGVTEDEITIALYKAQPDPLQQLLVEDAGADTDPDAVNQTAQDYLAMFADIGETYGRELNVVVVEATGLAADATAAAADAQKVIDLKPFAAIGGPGQTDVYWETLVEAEILCVGACSIAAPAPDVERVSPYLWPTGPNPDQADVHLLELMGKQLVGQPAEYAGDTALQTETRVFGWVQAERKVDEFKERNDRFEETFADEYGGEIAKRSTYIFDAAKGPEIATNVIAQMKEAGVTTIIMSTDPLVPKNITEEATKQNYFPEWIIGPSVLADTTIFGRTFDQQQWSHAFGLGLTLARQDNQLGDSWQSYEWYYGQEPPVNSHAVIYPGPNRLLLGIHLAGPNLTPETFRDGMFGYPPEEQGKTYAHDSWGNSLWPQTDYNSADDTTAIYWDPDATGEDEAGNEGSGMLLYVKGGERYLPGGWPDSLPWFDDPDAVGIYTELPAGDEVPDYPPWPGSPAAG